MIDVLATRCAAPPPGNKSLVGNVPDFGMACAACVLAHAATVWAQLLSGVLRRTPRARHSALRAY